MAISKDKWLDAKGLFELGYSLNSIEEKTGINRSSISKKSKKEGWKKAEIQHIKDDIDGLELENSTLVEKKSTLVEKVATLEHYQIKILHDMVQNETNNKSLVFTGLSLAAIRATQQLQKNKKQTIQKIKTGHGGGASDERIEYHDVELDGSDILANLNVLHKAGVSMGVIEDKPQVQIANQNNQNNEVEIIGYGVKTIEN